MLTKGQIGLAGEYRVASELLRRGFDASITMGNQKATDIIVTGVNNQFQRIEVKTSTNGRNFVTSYYPKYTEPRDVQPDAWVLFLPEDHHTHTDRFFIMTHAEVGDLQLVVNKGNKTEKGKGVDNIPLRILLDQKPDSENNWEVIIDLVRG